VQRAIVPFDPRARADRAPAGSADLEHDPAVVVEAGQTVHLHRIELEREHSVVAGRCAALGRQERSEPRSRDRSSVIVQDASQHLE
jgi:hypothetical protein